MGRIAKCFPTLPVARLARAAFVDGEGGRHCQDGWPLCQVDLFSLGEQAMFVHVHFFRPVPGGGLNMGMLSIMRGLTFFTLLQQCLSSVVLFLDGLWLIGSPRISRAARHEETQLEWMGGGDLGKLRRAGLNI